MPALHKSAFQAKLKLVGYNAAKELNDRLLAQMNAGPATGSDGQ